MKVELATMLDVVQETETKMMEMSALNHLLSNHVLQQAQQIEYLYEQILPKIRPSIKHPKPVLWLGSHLVSVPWLARLHRSSHSTLSRYRGRIRLLDRSLNGLSDRICDQLEFYCFLCIF